MQPLLAIESAPLASHTTSFLEIDTQAIAHNYKTLQSKLPNSTCAAVLKADAYGFGIEAIVPTLQNQGCNTFFVAHLEEGLFLRACLKNSLIYVLSGFLPNTEGLFVENTLIPVLTDFEMTKNWAKECQKRDQKLPCALHVDTGMRRSGFDQKDFSKLLESWGLLGVLDIHFVMSHLVSSHDLVDPLNEQQKLLFDSLRHHFPNVKASLADTGGIYLGSPYHYDLVRAGKGLFGLFTPPEGAPPLQPCLKLFGRILQIRQAHKGDSVGYGATYTLSRDSKLATLGIGFADGYDRRLSNNAFAHIQGFKAPVIGRISMDYTVIDVTDIPESLYYVGGWVELVNQALTLDILAHSIGTISRELSTRFGQRLHRVYK
ncbi:MAG: alanine racemase [Proteobacteria bacterium]|nr:alanine racemase [Pseudomonadota bacterium]